jgi:vacuolar iron transporter family protein
MHEERRSAPFDGASPIPLHEQERESVPSSGWNGSSSSWPSTARLPLWARRKSHGSSVSRVARIGWLRAVVLGANDGLVSVASIIVGVAAATDVQSHVLLSGVAGLAAGAMSMAAGEFVSVSSQADSETAALVRMAEQLRDDPDKELHALARIYVRRGLEPGLALKVSAQLTRHDAVRAHARDELGLSKVLSARPLQAATASALSFTLGGAMPMAAALFARPGGLIAQVTATTLLCLALLGAVGAWLGGARAGKAAVRSAFWGALAMAGTAAAGGAFGTVSE